MKNFKTIDAYIKSFPPVEQKVLKLFRKAVLAAAPGAEEAISYGVPTFKLHGKNLVHFGGFKNHLGFFPTPSAIQYFKLELAKFPGSKGTVQFPWSKPVPFPLVKRIVAFRVKTVLEKTSKK